MRRLIPLLWLLGLATVARGDGGVGFRETADTLEVTIDGKPFTTYRHGPDATKPFFWPIAVPAGPAVTRAFPNIADPPDETRDHVWHRGLSFTHGEVGVPGEAPIDFWREGAARQGKIVHRGFEPRPEVKGGALAFGTVDRWVGPDGSALLEDRVLWKVEDLGEGSALISSEYRLAALDRPVVFGDSEEGTFSVRVATSMDEKAEATGPRSKRPRGQITNSRGDVGASKCWGRTADWVDYSGPVGGKVAGLAIFDHPENRPRVHWHVRDYGLFSANPFGQKVFKEPNPPAPVALKPGETLTLRYAVLVHPGNAEDGKVARRFEEYVHPTASKK